MFKKKIFLASTVGLIWLSACQKEKSIERGNQQQVNLSTDSNYLWKFYTVTKQGNQYDTSVSIYNYDNLNRVSTIIFKKYNNGFIDERDSIIYFYNGLDTFPNQSKEYSSLGFTSHDTIFSFFSYNNINKLIKDSSIETSKMQGVNDYLIKKNISNYSYSTNKNLKYFVSTILYQDVQSFEQPQIEFDTATLDANRNTLSVKSKIIGGIAPSINITNRITTFTYDNKPSPFLLLNINNIFPYFPAGQNILYPSTGFANNHLLGTDTFIDSTGSFTYNDDFTGKYIYQANGFPAFILIPDNFVPTDFIKYIFEYKTL